jgi:hypothetical protein
VQDERADLVLGEAVLLIGLAALFGAEDHARLDRALLDRLELLGAAQRADVSIE